MMTNFYEVNLGASEATQKDLDEIALFHGGRLGTIGYGYRIRGPLPKDRHGYGFLWVNTQGMGNHGTLVLTPRSDRAREMLRAGRVLELEKEYNIPHKLALRLEAAQRGVPYSRESRIIKCVLANINSPDGIVIQGRAMVCGVGSMHGALILVVVPRRGLIPWRKLSNDLLFDWIDENGPVIDSRGRSLFARCSDLLNVGH